MTAAEDVTSVTGVFCNNLPFRTTEAELAKFVADELGDDAKEPKVHFFKMPSGKPRGTAMLYFEDKPAADRTVSELNNKEFQGRALSFREDRDPEKAAVIENKPSLGERQVFVGNLSWQSDWRAVKEHMAVAGEVEFCATMTNREGRHSGTALVRFKTGDMAANAISTLHNTELDGRTILVREDREGREIDQLVRKTEYALFVGGIDKALAWTEVKDHFRTYRPSHVDVGEMREGQNRGYAIVKFQRRQDAIHAKTDLDGSTLGSKEIIVKWDKNSP